MASSGYGGGYSGVPQQAPVGASGYSGPQQAAMGGAGAGGALNQLTSQPLFQTAATGRTGMAEDSAGMKVAYAISAFFLPPLAVGLKTGDPCEIGISIAFLFLGWIPAIVHAFLVCFTPTRCSCYPEAAMEVPPSVLIEQQAGLMGTKGGMGGGVGAAPMTTSTSSSMPYPGTGAATGYSGGAPGGYSTTPAQRPM